MTMHILQLGPYPPPEGGISRNMISIRDALIARGDKCSIIATSRSSRIDEAEGVFHPRSGFELISLLRKVPFDVVHLHIGGDVSRKVLVLALVTSVFGRKRCVLTLHSGQYPGTKKGLSAKPFSIRGMIFGRFSQVVAVNQSISNVFRRYGVEDERIHVILPFAQRQPDPDVVVPSELAHFCEKHSPLLLSVGGLEKDYDPLLQIAAMKAILDQFPNAGLLIVGDGSMLSEVETAVNATGYAEKILLAGNVDHAVTLHLIKDADIFLRTTLFDGDAISVREALFLGTPVIATDTGARPEGVHLTKIGDGEALVNAVKVVAGRGGGGNGDQESVDNISPVISLYESLLGTK